MTLSPNRLAVAVGTLLIAATGSAVAVAASATAATDRPAASTSAAHGMAGMAGMRGMTSTHVTASHGKKITAVETEFHIALSTHKGSPGKYTFVVKNKGTIKHGLVVDGRHQDDTLLGYVKPHHKLKRSLTLHKGKYEIYCPVPGHKMEGMKTHLTIK